MYNFELTGNRKTLNGENLHALQNGYLKFIYFIFTSQKMFLKNDLLSNQNFQVIQKPEYLLSRYIQTTHMGNFKAISLVLAEQLLEKGKRGDVTYLNAIFVICDCRT